MIQARTDNCQRHLDSQGVSVDLKTAAAPQAMPTTVTSNTGHLVNTGMSRSQRQNQYVKNTAGSEDIEAK